MFIDGTNACRMRS